MGTSMHKRLQVILLISFGAVLALGFTAVRQGFREIKKWTGPVLDARGPQTRQSRSIPDFNRIEAGDSYQVDVKLGSIPSVTIEAPQDLLGHLTARVEDGTLILGSDMSYSVSGIAAIKAHVVARQLVGASVSGASKMWINSRITTDQFDAHASGAGILKMEGSVNSLNIELSGSARAEINAHAVHLLKLEGSGASNCIVDGTSTTTSIELSGASNFQGNFTAQDADVQASGASHARLKVTKALNGEASGASEILYTGSPSQVVRNTSGVSSIEAR